MSCNEVKTKKDDEKEERNLWQPQGQGLHQGFSKQSESSEKA